MSIDQNRTGLDRIRTSAAHPRTDAPSLRVFCGLSDEPNFANIENMAPALPTSEDLSALPGRPTQVFRDQAVAYISKYVQSMGQLVSLSQLLKYDVRTLLRWIQEDAPQVSIAASLGDDSTGFDYGLGLPKGTSSGGVLEKLQQNLMASQAALLLQVLRDQASELTLGELRAVLSSRLGLLIANFKARALFDSTKPTLGPVQPSLPPTEPEPEPKAKRSQDYDSKVVAFLRANPGWNQPGIIRHHAGEPHSEYAAAMSRLITRGLVVRQGRGRATEYMLKNT